MIAADLLDYGWYRDLPDHRDFTPQHSVARRLLAHLQAGKDKQPPPTKIDWRDYFLPVQDQLELATSSAHAVIGLVQYFQRRSSGEVITPSRLFLHGNARRLAGGNCGLAAGSLRTTLKAAVKFGLPPERHWPYEPAAVDLAPDPFVYGFESEFRSLRYIRLDGVRQSGLETLETLKSYLAAGFVCVLGFGVSSSLTNEPEIPFPTQFDSIRTGQAVVVVGYDDEPRIRSEKGAFLVRNSWGVSWGMDGYGWLPFRYVTDKLAADIWTVLRPKWLRSGEFELPS
jgi:C1A family cysteine protease